METIDAAVRDELVRLHERVDALAREVERLRSEQVVNDAAWRRHLAMHLYVTTVINDLEDVVDRVTGSGATEVLRDGVGHLRAAFDLGLDRRP